jgi:hypothetical protein
MGLHQTKTGRPRTWNISSEESCPSTRPKLGDWLGASSRSFYWVMKKSCTTAAPQAFSNDAYLSPMDKSCYKKYTRGLAVTMQHLEPSWETLSDKVSTGRLSHPVLEGKPNANHVRARISYSRTQQLHNMDIITQCSK